MADALVPVLGYANFIRYGGTGLHAAEVSHASLPGHSFMTTIGVAAF
jgi:hypothetical protein